MRRKRIVVMGFMGAIPIAGVVWQHIHYIVGLQRLGHEVFYAEDSSRMPYHPHTFDTGPDYTFAAGTIERLAARFGFAERWCYGARFLPGCPTAGMPRERLEEILRSADAVLNVCGTQEIHEDLEPLGNLLYVESDPGLEQIRLDNGDHAPRQYLDRHRALFTFGENIGGPEFPVPLHGLRWMPTRQPVVTDLWNAAVPPPVGAVFTTVANWNTSGLKDIAWRGDTYLWSKSLEFLRFLEAPRVAGEPFEMATNIADADLLRRFEQHGWRIAQAQPYSVDMDAYLRYVQASRGEFTVAKDQYVRLRTGWFSDRSACYLAAGRPVITQATGFERHIPTGAGLFAFENLDAIRAAAAEIRADYARHSAAAREIAREYFEAEKVLKSLLDRASV
jgi:hypothetical protein